MSPAVAWFEGRFDNRSKLRKAPPEITPKPKSPVWHWVELPNLENIGTFEVVTQAGKLYPLR